MALISALITFALTQFEILNAMYLSGPIGEYLISDVLKRAMTSFPEQTKPGRTYVLDTCMIGGGAPLLKKLKEGIRAIVIQRKWLRNGVGVGSIAGESISSYGW